jgi:hypothetical protein
MQRYDEARAIGVLLSRILHRILMVSEKKRKFAPRNRRLANIMVKKRPVWGFAAFETAKNYSFFKLSSKVVFAFLL